MELVNLRNAINGRYCSTCGKREVRALVKIEQSPPPPAQGKES